MKRYLVPAGLALISALLLSLQLSCGLWCCEIEGTAGDEKENENDFQEAGFQKAPAFQGEELFSGETRQFPADWEGEAVYLNFFSRT